MPLEIVQYQIGPLDNNTYLAADPVSEMAVLIDPSFGSQEILKSIEQQGWTLSQVWLTHAHFDHIAGVSAVQAGVKTLLPVFLHPKDFPLWRDHGGARLFGFQVDLGPEPDHLLEHRQKLPLGSQMLEVRHTPGHTPGHVIFYSVEAAAAFCGDLIFFHGVGRTDLPGSSHAILVRSIHEEVFSLPRHTRLLSGHGIETTVEEEMRENPYV